MLRMKLVPALIALGISLTPAHAQTINSFRHDGNTYKYSTIAEGDTIRLTGVVVETGEDFDLSVHKGGFVKGAFGDRPVTFRVSKRVQERLAARLATADRLASGVEVSTR